MGALSTDLVPELSFCAPELKAAWNACAAGVPTPVLRVWPCNPPKRYAPSIYFLISRQEILYVGMSRNLNQRLRQHRQGRAFDFAVYVQGVPNDLLEQIEANLIAALTPPWNRKVGTQRIRPPVPLGPPRSLVTRRPPAPLPPEQRREWRAFQAYVHSFLSKGNTNATDEH